MPVCWRQARGDDSHRQNGGRSQEGEALRPQQRDDQGRVGKLRDKLVGPGPRDYEQVESDRHGGCFHGSHPVMIWTPWARWVSERSRSTTRTRVGSCRGRVPRGPTPTPRPSPLQGGKESVVLW